MASQLPPFSAMSLRIFRNVANGIQLAARLARRQSCEGLISDDSLTAARPGHKRFDRFALHPSLGRAALKVGRDVVGMGLHLNAQMRRYLCRSDAASDVLTVSKRKCHDGQDRVEAAIGRMEGTVGDEQIVVPPYPSPWVRDRGRGVAAHPAGTGLMLAS